jgi:hypothetical protein
MEKLTFRATYQRARHKNHFEDESLKSLFRALNLSGKSYSSVAVRMRQLF